MDAHGPDALSDEALDRELCGALSVEPSPEYVARLRTRVASEQARRHGWLSRGWLPGVAALATVAVVVAWPSPSVTPVEQPAPVTVPVTSAPVAPAPVFVEPRPVASWTSHWSPRLMAAEPKLPFVLFSEDERRALDTLVKVANGGRVDTLPEPKSVAIMDVNELAIVPLEITELPQIARLEQE